MVAVGAAGTHRYNYLGVDSQGVLHRDAEKIVFLSCKTTFSRTHILASRLSYALAGKDSSHEREEPGSALESTEL